MSFKTLTEDGVRSLCNLSNPPSEDFTPIVQLIDLQKKIPANQPGRNVWRLVLSDGMYYCEGCLASNLYHLIDGGLLKKYCFIKLLNRTSTLIGKTIVVVIYDLVVLSNHSGVLGRPARYTPSLFKTLTEDGVRSLCNLSNPPSEDFTPVVQLIDLQKKIPANQPGRNVWRLVLSDGMYYCEGCLASNLYHLIDGGLLKKYCFIKLLNRTSTLIGKTIVVVIYDLVVLSNHSGVLGRPARYTPSLELCEGKEYIPTAAPSVLSISGSYNYRLPSTEIATSITSATTSIKKQHTSAVGVPETYEDVSFSRHY